jgi:hypothetical protein
VNSAKPPDLSDIQSALEQMPSIPDWFWQGLVVWLAAKGLEWAWNHREEVAAKLRQTPEDIVINLQPISLHAEAQRITVQKDLDLRWRVQAPTPSLARRLEELAAWYFHIS